MPGADRGTHQPRVPRPGLSFRPLSLYGLCFLLVSKWIWRAFLHMGSVMAPKCFPHEGQILGTAPAGIFFVIKPQLSFRIRRRFAAGRDTGQPSARDDDAAYCKLKTPRIFPSRCSHAGKDPEF